MAFSLNRNTSRGQSQQLWPLFALLMAVIILPTAGVLWFMNQAMQNEQQAVQQRLQEIYRSRLQSAVRRIQSAWREKLLVPSRPDAKHNRRAEDFASMIKNGEANAVLFFQNSRRIYPEPDDSSRIVVDFTSPPWLEARNLEHMQNKPQEAAAAYKKISRAAGLQESALALMAQARCLTKSGEPQAAAELLIAEMSASRFRNTTDPQGRMIQPSALLFSLELTKNPAHPLFQKAAASLVERLNDYKSPTMSSSQRRFLMQQLKSLWPKCPPFPTLEGEELAAAFMKITPDQLKAGQIQPLGVQKIWAYLSPDRSMIALFEKAHLLKSINAMIAEQDPIPGVRFSLLLPGNKNQSLMTEEIGDIFPSWQLALSLEGEDPFRTASNRKITLYIWTGILMTSSIAVLSILLAAYLRRQIRLTRLKNDLIATVTHELKTPLASMRLLVDTLRDGHYQDTTLVQEYLQMISTENARLSRLIEDFLTFSRMERNKTKYDRSVIRPIEFVNAALDVLGERLQAPGCHFELAMAPELPAIIGDRDALVTVLVNLLDNALKYSGEEKQITLSSIASNGNLILEVQDNGIGFPRSAAKKIFDRFYQVDQSLSRRAGGCGLGLSIVKFIIEAHHGSVTAKSQPGKGSTFTVQLPIA